MKIGISSLLFPRSPPREIVRTVAELGASSVEFIFDIPHFPPGFNVRRLEKLRSWIDQHGLEVTVHGSFWDLNPMSHHCALRKLTTSQIKKSIRACEILGGRIVTVHPGRCWVKVDENLFKTGRTQYLDFIGECSEYASEREITLAIETGSRDVDYPHTLGEIEELAEEIDNLGVTLDVGHVYLSAVKEGMSPPERRITEAIREVKKWLVNVHIHDNRGFEDEHLVPGDGKIPFPEVLKELKKASYSGALTLELWNPFDPLPAARRAIEYLKSLLGRAHG